MWYLLSGDQQQDHVPSSAAVIYNVSAANCPHAYSESPGIAGKQTTTPPPSLPTCHHAAHCVEQAAPPRTPHAMQPPPPRPNLSRSRPGPGHNELTSLARGAGSGPSSTIQVRGEGLLGVHNNKLNQSTCTICLLDLRVPEQKSQLTQLWYYGETCGHLFCLECIKTWASRLEEAEEAKTCPMCKAHFNELRSYGSGTKCLETVKFAPPAPPRVKRRAQTAVRDPAELRRENEQQWTLLQIHSMNNRLARRLYTRAQRTARDMIDVSQNSSDDDVVVMVRSISTKSSTFKH